ncbi:MAG: alpha/beta hydrolase-fold protein, partial [Bacteroidales bacterium]
MKRLDFLLLALASCMTCITSCKGGEAPEKTYRCKTSRSDRAIAGLSMGGYGATYNGFKHCDKFCLSYSMSGAVTGNGTVETPAHLIDGLLAAGTSISSFPKYIMECGGQDQLVYSS